MPTNNQSDIVTDKTNTWNKSQLRQTEFLLQPESIVCFNISGWSRFWSFWYKPYKTFFSHKWTK